MPMAFWTENIIMYGLIAVCFFLRSLPRSAWCFGVGFIVLHGEKNHALVLQIFMLVVFIRVIF